MVLIIDLMNLTNPAFEAVLLQIGVEQCHANGIFAEAAGGDLCTQHGSMHGGTGKEALIFDLSNGNTRQVETFASMTA